MEFIRVSGAVINMDRVLSIQHRPEILEGISSKEHYRVTFDTGQELWLTVRDGQELVGMFRCGNGSDGTTATTSEAAT
jgi:hypothetical protein